MTRSMAWPFAMRPVPWDEISSYYAELTARRPESYYVGNVVTSVLASPLRGSLAAITSMYDLVVVATPVPKPPMEVIIVFGPGGHRDAPLDHMVIEHRSHGGNDRIVRPSEEAVPLFWRFVAERFGVYPTYGGVDPSSASAG